jgi:hypothetical protein
MRIEEEEIDASNRTPTLSGGCQVEHRVEIDGRLGARPALANQTGPHGIVELRKRVRTHDEVPTSFFERF